MDDDDDDEKAYMRENLYTHTPFISHKEKTSINTHKRLNGDREGGKMQYTRVLGRC